jgi:hypothetical protein
VGVDSVNFLRTVVDLGEHALGTVPERVGVARLLPGAGGHVRESARRSAKPSQVSRRSTGPRDLPLQALRRAKLIQMMDIGRERRLPGQEMIDARDGSLLALCRTRRQGARLSGGHDRVLTKIVARIGHDGSPDIAFGANGLEWGPFPPPGQTGFCVPTSGQLPKPPRGLELAACIESAGHLTQTIVIGFDYPYPEAPTA